MATKKTKAKKKKKMEAKLQKLSLMPKKITTWTQLKHLIKKAEKLVKAQQKPKTPKFIFLAILSLLICQNAVVHSKSYWAYVPKPPLIHPVG